MPADFRLKFDIPLGKYLILARHSPESQIDPSIVARILDLGEWNIPLFIDSVEAYRAKIVNEELPQDRKSEIALSSMRCMATLGIVKAHVASAWLNIFGRGDVFEVSDLYMPSRSFSSNPRHTKTREECEAIAHAIAASAKALLLTPENLLKAAEAAKEILENAGYRTPVINRLFATAGAHATEAERRGADAVLRANKMEPYIVNQLLFCQTLG